MSKLLTLLVVCSAESGYRRAGFALNNGENKLTSVSGDQFKQLNDDPRLTAVVIDDGSAADAKKAADKKTADAKKVEAKKVADAKKTQASK